MPSLSSTLSQEQKTDRLCPPGSWDVHHHIFDLDKFSLASTRHFTPSSAPLPSFEDFQHSLGIDHACIAHGLSFGLDVSSLLHYMKYFEGTSRAFGIIDLEHTPVQEMEDMKSKGIIGVRIDFHLHKAQHDVDEQIRCLKAYAERVQPLGWMLQIYHPHPEYYGKLESTIRSLPVPLVIDHFAGLKTASLLEYTKQSTAGFDAATQPGLATLCKLLRDGAVWIKLSAPYRCSEDPTCEDMKPLVRALVDANPDRVLYGSDWPHTQPFHRRPAGMKGTDVETYLPFDDMAWVKKLKGWLSESEWMKLMVHNPRVFTGYKGDD